jgi:hypothetical protein
MPAASLAGTGHGADRGEWNHQGKQLSHEDLLHGLEQAIFNAGVQSVFPRSRFRLSVDY